MKPIHIAAEKVPSDSTTKQTRKKTYKSAAGLSLFIKLVSTGFLHDLFHQDVRVLIVRGSGAQVVSQCNEMMHNKTTCIAYHTNRYVIRTILSPPGAS